MASELDDEGDVIDRVAAQVIARAPASKRIVQHAATAAHAVKADAEQLERSSTKMYVALAAGLGILTSLAVVAFVLLPGKTADTSYDMGSMTSTSNGLKGHLITNWGFNWVISSPLNRAMRRNWMPS